MNERTRPTTRNKDKAMPYSVKHSVLDALAERFPQHSDAVARLARLAKGTLPTVVVIGHYNHGKSSLLNALIEEDCFAVSDKRETVEVQIEERAGIRWVDTPGLDADLVGDDDRKAQDAASHESDLRVLVHAADLGELDRSEAALLARLSEEQEKFGRSFVLALTRIDKVSAADRRTIIEAIQAQAPEARILAVSSRLGVRGRQENKPRLAALGNLDALHREIERAAQAVEAERKTEFDRIARNIQDSVSKEQMTLEDHLEHTRLAREAKLAVMAPGMMLSLVNLNNELMLG